MGENLNNNDIEEISIRELIEILIKNWKMIFVITTSILVVTIIVTFMILKPSYQSESVLNVGNNQTISTETYIQRLKSPQLLTEVIKIGNLTNEKGELILANQLLGQLDIQEIVDTNLIKITVSSGDPKKAELIANTMATEFIKYNANKDAMQNEKDYNEIIAKLAIEENNVKEKSVLLSEYIANNISCLLYTSPSPRD